MNTILTSHQQTSLKTLLDAEIRVMDGKVEYLDDNSWKSFGSVTKAAKYVKWHADDNYADLTDYVSNLKAYKKVK